MSRPDTHTRTPTCIRFDGDTLRCLQAAAAERDVSMNWLVNRAVVDFLTRLLPIEEWRLTRDAS